MDTHAAHHPHAPHLARPAWWRQPLADLVDVVSVVVVAVAAGGAAATVHLRGARGDEWAELGALLVGLAVGAVVGLVGWISLLVVVARGGRSAGGRLASVAGGRALATAGRHLAVVVVGWSAVAVAAAATEPWPAGPVGGGVGAALGTAVALLAWGHLDLRAGARVAAVAAVAGLLLTGAVPDRDPYPWELRAEARAAALSALEVDPTARRVCGTVAVGNGQHVVASHATDPCHDPDRAWVVAATPRATAHRVEGAVRDAVGADAAVGTREVGHTLEVAVADVAVAIVSPRGLGCDSRVVLDRYDAAASRQQGRASCL